MLRMTEPVWNQGGQPFKTHSVMRVCEQPRIREGKQLLERVFAMLTKLIDRFDSED